jgi:hypothetical protein
MTVSALLRSMVTLCFVYAGGVDTIFPNLFLLKCPGVDVVITIFCDFGQFSAKNGVFLYDHFFAKRSQ